MLSIAAYTSAMKQTYTHESHTVRSSISHIVTFGLLPNDPEPHPIEMDSTRQQQAVALAKSLRKARLIYLLCTVVLLASVVLTVTLFPISPESIKNIFLTLIHTPVIGWQPIADWWPLFVLLGIVLVSVLVLAIGLPLVWYIRFAIPRRYGLRKDTILHWLAGVSKSVLLAVVQVVLLVELCTLLLVVQPQTWWAWAALAHFLYSLLLNRFGARWVFSWLHKVQPLPEGAIAERLRALLVRLHLPACPIFQVQVSHQTGAANAYFTGWGRGRRILLTDTLVQHFTLDEIEVILAHELGHLVHRDIWTRITMRSLIFLGVLYFLYLDVTDGSWLSTLFVSLPILQSLSALFALILLLVLLRLTMRYQRYQEYQADEFALQTTGKVQAFKTAMTRLTDMNMLMATSTRRLKTPASHPTLQQRLQHAEAFAKRQAEAMAQV